MSPDYKGTWWHQRLLTAAPFLARAGSISYKGLRTAQWYLFICKLMSHIKYGDKHVVG